MKREVLFCDSREIRMGKCLLYNVFLVPMKRTCQFMTGSFVLVTNKLMSNLLEDLKFISLNFMNRKNVMLKYFSTATVQNWAVLLKNKQ